MILQTHRDNSRSTEIDTKTILPSPPRADVFFDIPIPVAHPYGNKEREQKLRQRSREILFDSENLICTLQYLL